AVGGAAHGELVTTAVAGRSSAPGPGSPVVVLMRLESVRAMQKVPAKTPPVGSAGTTGLPLRVILPPPAVGKQGRSVLFAQHSWEMPPLASMQLPCASVLAHAQPVHWAVQAPPWQPSSWVWPPEASGHGFGPTSSLAVPVVRGSWMLSEVGGASPRGVQALDSKYRPLPATTTLPSTRQLAPGFFAVFEQVPTLPRSPPPPGMLQRGQTSGNVVRR